MKYLASIVVATLMSSHASAQFLSINDGVFTDAQATAGELLYEENCKHCHDLQFYQNSLISWTDMTVLDYWYRILGNMPADNPSRYRM